MAGKQERIMFIYLCEKSRICIFWQKRLFLQAEEKGFEPLRRCYRPTGVRSQTLQPLGYSSGCMGSFRKADMPAGKHASYCIIH